MGRRQLEELPHSGTRPRNEKKGPPSSYVLPSLRRLLLQIELKGEMESMHPALDHDRGSTKETKLGMRETTTRTRSWEEPNLLEPNWREDEKGDPNYRPVESRRRKKVSKPHSFWCAPFSFPPPTNSYSTVQF